MMRSEGKKNASYICKKVNGERITVEELRESIREGNTTLLNHITRSAEQLRGSRPYWKKRSLELENMVLNLDAPHLFFTFSAADLQWHDLRSQMPGFEGLSELPEPQRLRTASTNLNINPHITAYYLVRRFKLFFKHVLSKVFGVRDHWYRFEWQERGSGHIHGFLWLEGPPPARTRTPIKREMLAGWWSEWVTAVNPDSGVPFGMNPGSLPFHKHSNTKLHLTECLNRYQRHSRCTPAYCLRKLKGSDERRCRFHFPQAFRTVAEVSRDQNPLHYKFLPVRNDTLLNAYIPSLTLGWNANNDMSPCTNINGVLRYVGKYASKAETKSEPYNEMFANAIRNCSERNPFLSTAMKMMNRLIGERDWSTQEINHLCLGLNLVEYNREFVSLGLHPNDEQTETVEVEDGEILTKGLSWLDKYKIRNTYTPHTNNERLVDELTLFEFARELVIENHIIRKRPRAKERIL